MAEKKQADLGTIKNKPRLRYQVKEFIAKNYKNTSFQSIADHFDFKTDTVEYETLKDVLADLANKGEAKRSGAGHYFVEQNVGFVIVRAERDNTANDSFVLTPLSWPDSVSHISTKPEKIRLQNDSIIGAAKISHGDLFIARVSHDRPAHTKREKGYKASLLESINRELIGTLKVTDDGKYFVKPASYKKKYVLPVSTEYVNEAHLKKGSLVRFHINPLKLENGCPRAHISAAFGDSTDYKNISKVVAMMYGLSPKFNDAVMAELRSLNTTPSWANRTDLTHIPFVTIDDITTTDMDDAMWCQPDTNPNNPNGWHLIVAIADVAQYVRWNGEIDKAARERGNTTYLPGYRCDMIPNELASDLCSLVPNEPRSCLAIHMWMDQKGKLINKKIQRGVMISRAKLHHKQVEAAMSGNIDEQIAPHMEQIKALYAAYEPMAKRAKKRGQLPIESKEQKIAFDADGNFDKIEMRPYMDINRVIEQWMVMANVAAAQLLVERKYPGIYRTHEQPSEKGVAFWSSVLGNLGYHINPDKPLKPQLISTLEKSKGTEEQDLIHIAVIRMQSRAQYLIDDDIGHYGLSLTEYAHFTSPIRRYADLMVHRFLIDAYKLGDDGLGSRVNRDQMMQICGKISTTERQSQKAEIDVRERFSAVWAERELIDSAKKGEERHYRATITDIRDDGLIVEIKHNGVQGFIPVESLPGVADYVLLNEYSAFGTREDISQDPTQPAYRQLAFQRGASLDIQLVGSDPIENSILFKPSHEVCAIIEKYRNGIMTAIEKQFKQRELQHDFRIHGNEGRISKRRKKAKLASTHQKAIRPPHKGAADDVPAKYIHRDSKKARARRNSPRR